MLKLIPEVMLVAAVVMVVPEVQTKVQTPGVVELSPTPETLGMALHRKLGGMRFQATLGVPFLGLGALRPTLALQRSMIVGCRLGTALPNGLPFLGLAKLGPHPVALWLAMRRDVAVARKLGLRYGQIGDANRWELAMVCSPWILHDPLWMPLALVEHLKRMALWMRNDASL